MIPTSRILSLTFATMMAPICLRAHADLAILQYHHISDTTPASTSTSRSLFSAQMDMIDELGLDVVPLETGTRAALSGGLDATQKVAITFDDGYESVLTHAAPTLLAKGFPFTVFVNTAAVGHHGYLNWAQLLELSQQPGVDIANHSNDHGHLIPAPNEPHEDWLSRVQTTLDKAEADLKDKLGSAPPLFAYPYGEFSIELETQIGNRGWYGYGQQSGAVGVSSSATRLPRFPMANAYGQLRTLKDKLMSRAFPMDAGQLPDNRITENPPLLTLSLPPEMDVSRLSCFASGQGRINLLPGDAPETVSIRAPGAFASRRFRYNCTYPAGDGRYYWLSQSWIDQSLEQD